MTAESKRIIIASVLIFVVLLFQPYYLRWIGVDVDYNNQDDSYSELIDDSSSPPHAEKEFVMEVRELSPTTNVDYELFTISSPLYQMVLSNNAGGSIVSSSFYPTNKNDNRFYGGFDKYGMYQHDLPVSIAPLDGSVCSPCLAFYDYDEKQYMFFDMPFALTSDLLSNNIDLSDGESVTLEFQHAEGGWLIKKQLTFRSDNYVVDMKYILEEAVPSYPLELYWAGGLRPTELFESDDITNGYAMVAQGDERVDVNITSGDKIERTVYNGASNWVAVRNKYFISSLIPKTPSAYATLSASGVGFGDREFTPVYNMSIGYNGGVQNIAAQLYLGPLDIDYIDKLDTNLDSSMSFGFSLIKPIGKFVLFLLKFFHDTLRLNYGVALILFAFLVWFVTRPLTKKAFESSKKMQKVAPMIKKVQTKYKDNPQKMNQEVMRLYKENGANPLGGCLPMLLQMPLLWSLFVVFRSTIEFRGANFIFWINDLSQPDILFNLPFRIPLYGDYVALLPILMGISIFMTQKMSMATMDPAQKPFMYIMNGFFILIFNSFPSGLNLYYTVYNLLNFYQQKTINAHSE
tara:strand:+ start:101 stop:1822 length:1722 start_codon:yes stop_codon:yes gene_type:complete